MQSRIAVYAGSFDPVTFGHLDLMQRAGEMFDHLIIAIGVHPTRSPVFSVPYTMCLLGWATIVGFSRIVARRQRVTWERVPGEPGPRVASRPNVV